jgi:hypothetical protein
MTKTSFSSTSTGTSNPFETVVAPKNPFAVEAPAEARGPRGYALVTSGPAVDPSEVEVASRNSVEISIAWGTTMLHVTHLAPPCRFVVGEGEGCDYQLPAEKIGTSSAPLVVHELGQLFAVVLPGATGWIELPGKERLSLADARGSAMAQPCPEVPGAVKIALPPAARLRQEVGDLVLTVGAVAAGKRVRRALLGAASLTGLLFAGLSFLGHASLLGGLAFFKPALSGAEADEDRAAREVLMMQMLKAAAEKEQEKVEEPTETPEAGASAGEGAAAQGASGKMGSTVSSKSGGKFAIKGSESNRELRLSREQAREEAARFGIIGLLQANVGGDSNAPAAPWGQNSAEGRDAFSAMGNMWGASLEESNGNGGLGLSGIGIGGDGHAESIGLGRVGTLFGGAGTCKEGTRCDGIGNSHGVVQGGHTTRTPAVRISTPSVSGRIAPEVIQRIVRQSFGRFRLCYENGLRSNPSLQGRVAIRFLIDRSGRVTSAANAGSDLPDNAVVSCVASAFAGMSFPEPENGIVAVTYPISFSPGN